MPGKTIDQRKAAGAELGRRRKGMNLSEKGDQALWFGEDQRREEICQEASEVSGWAVALSLPTLPPNLDNGIVV